MNREFSKIFSQIKAYGEQPGRELSCLPSGLATFTGFALRLAFTRQTVMSLPSLKKYAVIIKLKIPSIHVPKYIKIL